MEKVLFHGTGGFAYRYEGGTKYDGIKRGVYDRLGSILSQGIKPSYDPLNSGLSIIPEISETVSLTQKASVAILYSAMFESELHKTGLSNLGRWYFFWKYLIETAIFSDQSSKERNRQKFGNMENVKEAALWRGDSLKVQNNKGLLGVLNQLLGMAYFVSDIPENFPIVFEVNSEGLEVIPMRGKINAFERRVGENIQPERIRKVYVPDSVLEEVRMREDVSRIGIEVISIKELLTK